jgi:hypothetical protein
MIRIIDKNTIKMKAEEKIEKGYLPKHSEMIDIVEPFMAGLSDDVQMFKAMNQTKSICSPNIQMSDNIKKYGGVFHVPVMCKTLTEKATNGKKVFMSISEMLQKGVFDKPKMSGNSLPVDWQNLWDALRIDISIRKAAMDTVRQEFYNIINMPNSSRIIDVTEFFPYAFEFTENNGEGQSVNQGETRGGQVEPVTHSIYATGFTRTLLSELFDNSYDPSKVSDGVLVAYNAKRDDLSIDPILQFNYSGVSGSQTPADTTSGAERQELLYNTLEDAIDDLGERTDPVTGRKIDASDLALLCSPLDARHVQRVIGGFTGPAVGGQNAPKNLPAIPEITRVVAYDGEVIQGRVKSVTYSGVTNGKAYLVKKNRYMNVGIKRGLTVEADVQPDVSTLAREKRSWYFVEGQQVTGIGSFVQEITLPAW